MSLMTQKTVRKFFVVEVENIKKQKFNFNFKHFFSK